MLSLSSTIPDRPLYAFVRLVERFMPHRLFGVGLIGSLIQHRLLGVRLIWSLWQRRLLGAFRVSQFLWAQRR